MSHKKSRIIWVLWISMIACFSQIQAQTTSTVLSDSCTINDICSTAIDLGEVTSDQPFICVQGCTMGALPEVIQNPCGIGEQPTVWYRISTDGLGTVLNIYVRSDDFETPRTSVFRQNTDCSNLTAIGLTSSDLPCVFGSDGKAEAIGTVVGGHTTYYIAVSSESSLEGTFELCMNVLSQASVCVARHDIEIVQRSDGGSLAGPFYPGETISVCMNVNEYTAAENGCQWFQGLVPVFGNGWDPSSFDANGQPLTATINGITMGVAGNGLYGASTWDWFIDVDYHYENDFKHVGDLDGNGTVEMCHTLYQYDCPDLGGLEASCCGPCWDSSPGTILPPGWFAYGVNGTCPAPGPPIRVDWGDGNTCGGGMGPWKFCFDLKVRSSLDCLTDSTTRDLSLGFFTFSDGETGSWTGSASVCNFDQPAMLTLPMNCFTTTDLGIEFLQDFCAGDSIIYQISHPGVSHWIWSISPSYAVLNPVLQGDNGFIIENELYTPLSGPLQVTYSFTGYEEGTDNQFTKKVRFRIGTPVSAPLPQTIRVCEDNKDTLHIEPLFIQGGFPPYTFLWLPGGESSASVVVLPPHQPTLRELIVTDEAGCTSREVVHIELKPCLLDTIKPTDESGEEPTEEDPPIDDDNFSEPEIKNRSESITAENELKVFPVPATDEMLIEWSTIRSNVVELIILDLNGNIIQKNSFSSMDRQVRMRKVNIHGFASGVHVVVLKTKDSFYVSRMVKM